MEQEHASQLEPGPLDPTVLTGQESHRSKDVWTGTLGPPLATHGAMDKFWSLLHERPIHPLVMQVLVDTGFYGVIRVGRIKLDRGLITALVERWRPETHTFHFRQGEATITLEDVAVLFGLPVDGEPFVGDDSMHEKEYWQMECFELMGFRPDEDQIDHNRLEVSALHAHLDRDMDFLAGADMTIVHKYARCYIFWLIGGMLFSDTSGNKVKLSYLSLLRDIDAIGRYSWGSATLGWLYRAMCRASHVGAKDISGFLSLLQLWAWERLLFLHPKRSDVRPRAIVFGDNFPAGPYGSRWNTQLSWTNVSHNVLPIYRDQFDYIIDDVFVWRPYSPAIMATLPDYCLSGQHLWRADVPLICWEVVEVQQPQRVMRQFGCVQEIPALPIFDSDHYLSDRRMRLQVNYAHIHAAYVSLWGDRANRVVPGVPTEDVSMRYDEPYMIWYRTISRQIIGNPLCRPQHGNAPNGPGFEALTRALHRILDYVTRVRDHTDDTPRTEILDHIIELADVGLREAMQSSRQHAHANYEHSTQDELVRGGRRSTR